MTTKTRKPSLSELVRSENRRLMHPLDADDICPSCACVHGVPWEQCSDVECRDGNHRLTATVVAREVARFIGR